MTTRTAKKLETKGKSAAAKARHTSQRARGKVKATAGRATGDGRLRAEGLVDETLADLKDAAGKVAHAARNVGHKAADVLVQGKGIVREHRGH